MMRTLRQRLTLTHTLVALLAVLLMALLAGNFIIRAYRELNAQQTRAAVQRFVPFLARAYASNRGDWDTLTEQLHIRLDESPQLENRRLLITDERGVVQFDSGNELEGQPLPRRWRPLREPIIIRPHAPPVGFVVVPLDSDNQTAAGRAFLRSIIFIVTLGGIAATTAALLVALLVARRLTAPLRSLTQAARRLASGEQHQPITPPAEAELGELARAFNSMAAELEHQEMLRRHMMEDITHELRTPLSVLRLQIEGLQDGVEQPTPDVLGSLHQEVSLLTRLVEDLRLIALADAGQLSLNIETLDARSALEHAAAAALPHARQRGIDLRHEADGTLPPIRADAQRLAQMLGNLLENALRYTPPGGQVIVRAREITARPTRRFARTTRLLTSEAEPEKSERWLAFEVADSGPGIMPEDLPHVFNRFYRTDRARARETGGSGLGLAIVEQLAHAQSGSVDVRSAPGKGTTFRVVLPVAAIPQEPAAQSAGS
jgi:signal transduction histidine kinase